MLTFITFLNDVSGLQLWTDNPIVLHCVPSTGNEAIAEDDEITFFVDITLPLTATVIQLQGKFVGGECIIDISENLRAYLEFTLPTALGITLQDTAGVVPFTVSWGLEDETGTIFSDASLSTYYALLGGFSKFDYPNITDRFAWLTRLEHYQGTTTKKIPYEALAYLFFYLSPDVVSVSIDFNFVGSSQNYSENVSTANTTKIFPLARTFSSIIGITNVVSIEITVNAATYSQVYLIEIDKAYKRQKRIFIFQNSIGGMDTVCFTGERERIKEVQRSVATRNLRYDYGRSAASNFVFAVDKSNAFKQYSGYISKSEIRYLQDEFLASENIWEVVPDAVAGVVFRAIVLETKKIDYDEDSVLPQAIDFQYSYAL